MKTGKFRINTEVANRLAVNRKNAVRAWKKDDSDTVNYYTFEFSDNFGNDIHIEFDLDGYVQAWNIGDIPLVWLLSIIEQDYPQLVDTSLPSEISTNVYPKKGLLELYKHSSKEGEQ